MTGGFKRRLVLGAGLLVIAGLNYLDVTGALTLPGPKWLVSLVVIGWTGLSLLLVGEDDLEVVQHLRDGLRVLMLWGLLMIELGAVYADKGTKYILEATMGGQIASATFPVVVLPVFLLSFVYVLDWVAEYHELRRTTPEERVLGREP